MGLMLTPGVCEGGFGGRVRYDKLEEVIGFVSNSEKSSLQREAHVRLDSGGAHLFQQRSFNTSEFSTADSNTFRALVAVLFNIQNLYGNNGLLKFQENAKVLTPSLKKVEESSEELRDN